MRRRVKDRPKPACPMTSVSTRRRTARATGPVRRRDDFWPVVRCIIGGGARCGLARPNAVVGPRGRWQWPGRRRYDFEAGGGGALARFWKIGPNAIRRFNKQRTENDGRCDLTGTIKAEFALDDRP